MTNITIDLCKALYLEYTDNYLTLDVFTEHMNYRLNIDKSVGFYESIINRGKIAFHGASYDYFTGANMIYMNSNNKPFFNKRRCERLLSEYSA